MSWRNIKNTYFDSRKHTIVILCEKKNKFIIIALIDTI